MRDTRNGMVCVERKDVAHLRRLRVFRNRSPGLTPGASFCRASGAFGEWGRLRGDGRERPAFDRVVAVLKLRSFAYSLSDRLRIDKRTKGSARCLCQLALSGGRG